MTVALSGDELAVKLEPRFPAAIIQAGKDNLLVKAEALFNVALFLKTEPEYDFDFLSSITAADYTDHFEVIYQMTSIGHNHSLILKVRCGDKNNAVVPSVIELWQGADFQEREIFDMFGIKFEGHPNLKRIFLWPQFSGYPLRKDFVNGA